MASFSCKVLGRDEIRCIAFSPSGKRIVVGSSDGNIRMFYTPSVQEFMREGFTFPTQFPHFQVLDEHEGYVTSVHFCNDGKKFVTGSSDGTARVWSFDMNEFVWKSRLLCVYKHASSDKRIKVNMITFSSNGDFIMTSSTDKALRVFVI